MNMMNVKEMSQKHWKLGAITVGAVAMALVIGGTVTTLATSSDIGATEAQTIALAHAGVSETQATKITVQKDVDNGVMEYDVEFWVENVEYDYDINASTGEIISYDWDVEKIMTDTASTNDTTSTTDDTQQVETPVETTSTAVVESQTAETQTVADESYIGEAQAVEIALAHAGIAESDTVRLKTEFDIERGVAEYEVEWKVGTMEYDYTIDAATGSILEYDVELDD